MVTPQQETEPNPALPVVSLALRLLIPTFVVFWAVLGPVVANPDNPSDRRALPGLAHLAMDSNLNTLAIESWLTFGAFALALLALAWVNWIACDIVIACHRSRGLRAQSLPFGLVRRVLSFIQVLAGVGAVAAVITYINIVAQSALEPVWTALLLVAGGGYLIWTCREAKRWLT
ncbi:MAG: hypothetical protein ABJA81_13555 [Nocardioidaceae bacterium]